jgi:hypothetical protein
MMMIMNITSKFINHKTIINSSLRNQPLLFVTTIKQALTTNAFINTSINRPSTKSFSITTATATTTTQRITRTNLLSSTLSFLSNHYESVGCKKYFALSFSSTSISTGRNRNVETDNNESDLTIWYKLFLNDDYKVDANVNIAVHNKYIATIKRLVKQENSETLKNVDAPYLQVFSGIEHDNQLENDVDWDQTIHGGGIQNPLVVKAYKQSTVVAYEQRK